jgi:TRAP-type C4-dicarboxylate transport system permease large subunit
MSETIPPSIVPTTVGSVTGVSIAALFTGGLMPAVVGLIALCVVVYVQTRSEDVSHAPRYTWTQRAWLFVVALPRLGLPIVISSAVVKGVATATEVSTIGIRFGLAAPGCPSRRVDPDYIDPVDFHRLPLR